MGGYGSGRRWSSKSTIEDFSRIDVLWMKRRGHLESGSGGSLTWSRYGEAYSTIGYRIEFGAMRLIYKSRSNGGEWQDVDFTVPISWSDCRFGGKRPYFICQGLGCGKRVQHLYAGNPYFVCRHCLNLAYTCQREELHDRAARRAEKIRERAGDEFGILDGPIFIKPKGMHWKTFYRLKEEETYYRKISLRAISDKLGVNTFDMYF